MDAKKIFISAAEPSGDQIAAEVMAHCPKDTRFIGIGGEQMAKQGLTSLFPMSELTVMGFTKVLPKIYSILRRINQTADYIIQENPPLVLTVDAYSFHCRLAKKLRKKGYKGRLIQYVPPAVWAWKASRAKTVAQLYDHVYCIFPCEPAYFEPEGIPATFVGHPAVYRLASPDPTFRERNGLRPDSPLIMILPGSRAQEITSLLPIYLEAATRILRQYPNAQFVIPTFTTFKSLVEKLAADRGIQVHTLVNATDKYACFHEASLAIAASGTVALELACYGVPTIIGYVTSKLNYWLARKFATVKYICTVNILGDELIIPELIQDECTPDQITTQALILLANPSQQKEKAQRAISQLKAPQDILPQVSVANAEIIGEIKKK